MKVLVITGGTSSERKISLMSAKQVRDGLKKIGHKVILFDFKKSYLELKKLVKDSDVIFPVIHGEEGEGGKLQAFLKKLKKPFVGGDPTGFKMGWFKIPFKTFCDKAGIATSPWERVKNPKDILKFSFPSVLKASSGGSSREVVILKTSKDMGSFQAKKLLKSKLELLIERFLPGVEVTVGILGNKALPVVEIIPPKGGWFDYKNKYSGKTAEVVNAPSLKTDLHKKLQAIATKIHKTFNLGPYSRIDFIVSDNKPYVLEINTIPGLTSQSLLPKAAAAVGISFPKLLDKIIKLALRNSKNPQVQI